MKMIIFLLVAAIVFISIAVFLRITPSKEAGMIEEAFMKAYTTRQQHCSIGNDGQVAYKDCQ